MGAPPAGAITGPSSHSQETSVHDCAAAMSCTEQRRGTVSAQIKPQSGRGSECAHALTKMDERTILRRVARLGTDGASFHTHIDCLAEVHDGAGGAGVWRDRSARADGPRLAR